MASKKPVVVSSGELELLQDGDTLENESVSLGSKTTVVLNSTTIAYAASFMYIEEGTESNLETITGGSDGTLLVLRADAGVKAKKSVGNLTIGANVLFGTDTVLLLLKDGTNWYEV